MLENFKHRVLISCRGCNLACGVEFENATMVMLCVPQCKCDARKRDWFTGAVITNAFGKANVHKFKFNTFHFDNFKTSTLNHILPSRLQDHKCFECFPAKNHPTITKWLLILSDNTNYFDLNFNFKYAVLEQPTKKYPWTNFYNSKFDSCTDMNFELNENCAIYKQLETQINFETFPDFQAWVSTCSINIWIWLDKNVDNFATICNYNDWCYSLIDLIEKLNKNSNTYYGCAVLMYVLNRIRPRDWQFVEFYKHDVLDRVRYVFKDDPDNVELKRWAEFDGNVDKFITPGLANIIKRVEFDAAYKWFCKNVNVPTIIDRGQIKCYCNALLDHCLLNKQYNDREKHAHINGVQYVVQKCRYVHSVLLTDAIMRCAAKNNNLFKLGSDDAPAQQIVINVAKYPQLWRFIDLINTYNYTGVELNMHSNRVGPNGKFKSYCCMKKQYIYYDTLVNRYLQSIFFKFVANLHDIFATFHSRCTSTEPMVTCFPKDFVHTYLNAHRATHVHVMRRQFVFKPIDNADDTDENNVMIKNKILAAYMKNKHVFGNDRQLCIIEIQRWFKNKIYSPDSAMVGKLKERYERNYEILLNQ
ncbi:hypothetical protein [Orgyia pseudotsugata single capsid nuclopolyhedrovirus]|nr:hypothetical protein [Orgyia pseudotsugata single capsid nuclopolyhedrovirus]